MSKSIAAIHMAGQQHFLLLLACSRWATGAGRHKLVVPESQKWSLISLRSVC